MQELELAIHDGTNIVQHLEALPGMWSINKPSTLPNLTLLTKSKSKSSTSTVTIYVWGLGRIGITVMVQCIEKEGMCHISIDANATHSATSTHLVERTITELLAKRLNLS